MGTDYEKYYQGTKQALGKPTREFVQFFDAYPKANARVLDVGCGQGRDAIFIARLGHTVVGVDASPTGISDMIEESEAEHLSVSGETADIRSYQPEGEFDIVLIDRTLHMLNENDRLNVLRSLVKHVAANGHLLIADEHFNMDGFQQVLEASEPSWEVTTKGKGFLFAARAT